MWQLRKHILLSMVRKSDTLTVNTQGTKVVLSGEIRDTDPADIINHYQS